jgi:multidrug resistance efflux pump
MGFKLSAGLGLALLLLAGSFKMYYDKAQAEIKSFHLQLERSIQNQKMLEGTIEQQNENLEETIENHERMLSQVERLQKENMMAQNEVTDIRKKFSRHSMDVLSIRKPKLIENIINRGTKSVLNELKVITDETQFDENTTVSTSITN